MKRVDTGEKTFFENMTEFGKQQGMSAVKICELLNGKRKTYKGWTAVELRAVKETVGSFENVKEKEKPKVITYNGETFQNIITKEIFYIENIAEYKVCLSIRSLKALNRFTSPSIKYIIL